MTTEELAREALTGLALLVQLDLSCIGGIRGIMIFSMFLASS